MIVKSARNSFSLCIIDFFMSYEIKEKREDGWEEGVWVILRHKVKFLKVSLINALSVLDYEFWKNSMNSSYLFGCRNTLHTFISK